jgi:transposase InsO family protein
MKELVLVLLHLLTAFARLLGRGGTKALVAENLLIKQHLLILTRSRQRAPNLVPRDRLLLGVCSLFLRPGRLRKVAVVLRPATLLAFHRCLVRGKYRALFSSSRRGKPGPKGTSEELVRAIVALKCRNPRFGCPRIALIIARTFGVEIDKDVVRRVLAKHYRPKPGTGGPSWLTFIGHAKDSLWSVDLFRCESIMLTSHWVLVVMDQFTRRIVGVGVHRGTVDGMALCRMINHAIVGQRVPSYLSSDHDPLFEYHRWQANLRVLDVEEIKTVPYVPQSHPFVECLIGTIRREFLDQVLFWNSVDLESKLLEFRDYYNRERVHSGIGGSTLCEAGGALTAGAAKLDDFRWQVCCRGLYQLPAAA